jgi:hypothetical protein
MDSSREDQPRISVGTVQGWRRLKDNYKHAVLTHVEEGLTSNGVRSDKDALIAHMNRVHKPIAYIRTL